MIILKNKIPNTLLIVFLLLLLIICLYYFNLFKNINGDIYVGSQNVWGDWPLHFTWASYFVYNSFPPKMHPLLYGHKPIYPWLTDSISAGLIKIGIPFYASFIIPNIIFSFLLIIVLFIFYKKILKSSKLSLLTIFLLLTNGGIGFIYFFKTLLGNPSYFLFPPHTYSQLSHLGLEFINFTSGLLVPQRAFLFGSLIGLYLIFFIYKLLFGIEKLASKSYLFYLILFFSLPFAHTHAFLSTIGISLVWILGFYFKKKNKNKLYILLLIPILLSTIGFLFFYKTNETSNYIRLVYGWYCGCHNQNIIIFWFKNWTVVPFIAFISYCKSKNKLFYLPFLLLFIFANFIQIQPYLFDNTKLFFFSAVGLYPLVTEFIANIKHKYIATLLIIFISLTGVIEVYKMGTDLSKPKLLFTKQEIEQAEWVKSNVPINTVMEIENKHNHYIPCLTGRQVRRGYTGWLENYGFDFKE